MDEIKNESEEIVATNETADEETYYADDDSCTSNLPAIGVGVLIGTVIGIGAPKLFKGAKKVVANVGGKVKSKVGNWANNEEDSKYVKVKGNTEEEED